MTTSIVYTAEFVSWHDSLPRLIKASGLLDQLAGEEFLLIKPNLVENLPPPITTPVQLVAEIVAEVRRAWPRIRIMVAEGCGAVHYDTAHVFSQQGYAAMARQYSVDLVDLNQEECRDISISAQRCWPIVSLPKLLTDVFLLSVPVLKVHTLAGVTLTLKNMMGAAPPARYQQGGNWRKAAFHEDIHGALHDLNKARCPDFTIMDATIGMQEAHLWGKTCCPAKNKLAASVDPVAIDAWGADLLGFGWPTIAYIRYLDGIIGTTSYSSHEIAGEKT